MAKPKSTADVVRAYCDGVMSGKIAAGEWHRKAVARHIDDLKHGHKRGLRFDPKRAAYVIEFFGFLVQFEGEWANQPFHLEPWQMFIVWVAFGWYRADGTRRFRYAYVELPRKNGKTTVAAGIALFLLIADGEAGAQVYVAATKKDQARIAFNAASEIARATPALRAAGRLKNEKAAVAVPSTASSLRPLSSDHSTMDGLNPSGAIIDELHEHKTPEVVQKLRTATGARRQPLLWMITTAGIATECVGYNEHKYARNILDRVFEDDAYFALIASADAEDDWASPATWAKANPNYGVSVKPPMLADMARRAVNDPSTLDELSRYHLNRWLLHIDSPIPLHKWDECPATDAPNELVGRRCFLGLDLSNVADITAAALIFPPEGEAQTWRILMRYWIPRDNMLERIQRDRIPYDRWAREGRITVTEGNVVDYDQVRADINALADQFEIVELGADPWNATQLTTQLLNDGLAVVAVRQGYATLSPATKFLQQLIYSRELDHGGCPVLRWMVGNLAIQRDPSGNIKPAKDKATQKIDGVSALVTGLARAMLKMGAEEGPSMIAL
ncbi:MAG TPA: terminase large subunit [Dehalococcoidia bacterium]|nr:terminase large subunit [Dehalococcoidia bacterium]